MMLADFGDKSGSLTDEVYIQQHWARVHVCVSNNKVLKVC